MTRDLKAGSNAFMAGAYHLCSKKRFPVPEETCASQAKPGVVILTDGQKYGPHRDRGQSFASAGRLRIQ